MTPSYDRLRQFVRDILESHHAVVECPRDDTLEALFPPELSKESPFGEFEKFYFDNETKGDDGIFLSYQSDLFDSFYRLLDTRGIFTQVELPTAYLKQSGFKEAIENNFVLTNGIYRFQEGTEKKISSLFVNYRYTAISEEKKEGIIQQGINEYTLAGMEWSRNFSEGRPVGGSKWESRYPVEECFARASLLARAGVQPLLNDFKKKLNLRLDRDIKRLREYYGSMVKENKKKITKRNLDGSAREKELTKIEAIKKELKSKITDQRDRYKMRIKLQPINAIRVIMPVMVLSVKIQRKKAARVVEMVWNPFFKRVEPLSCESCFRPVTTFSLCNDRLHLLCKNCDSCKKCGKFHCTVCSPKKCKKCGEHP